ncbi:SH3 domain-containing protein [Paraburkholderia acidisoli]|uniref:SH3 domain-containing protein n=1 Tax=Paraburkholderia acidisoli TaxID=2571748 RepID=A0A7Z2JIC9_9BURK|nr:SH3 domain-containing protein [Paraburkholderia acidisoli]QGZ64190.1 SH3 domain-containing protein [Paraburkholderia acidisoli]
MSNRSGPRQRALTAALAATCLATGLSLAATDAQAQTAAYTSEPVDVYAGPSGDYPVVSEIGPNEPVTVMGCVGDYSWCDVTVEGLRGWVYGGYLSYPYQGGYVPLTNYGAAIGLPVITFSLGAYWGSFYRDRPWYGEQARWAHVPPPERGHPPPGPPAWHGQPGRPPGPPPGGGGRPPGNYGGPQHGGPPEAGRPPGAPGAPGNMPPGDGRPPGNYEMQRGRANPPGSPQPGMARPPQGNAEPPRPANNMPANVPRAPEPQRAPEQARPAAPAPQAGGRPAGGPPPGGGMHGPAPEQHGGGRPEAPQGGGHGNGGGGGHGDQHQP